MNQPTFFSRQIGDFLVTAVSDGNMAASLDLLSGIGKPAAEAIQHSAGVDEPGIIHINCYLIRGRGRTMLVDSGTGGLNNAGGRLSQNLRAAGVSPDDIDTLLITHCHPDHIGGLLDDQGLVVYKNARLYLHALEAEYWRDDHHFNEASERGQRNFLLARRVLDAYASRLHIISEDEITEGIRPVWLPGHTPGHTGFQIDSTETSLLIWGDVVHFPHIQSAHPAVSIMFDCNSAQAEQTRAEILRHVARENLLVAGMHFGTQGFAYIHPSESGYSIKYTQAGLADD
ncbi:MBL fold metallo-hydrolase [Buttiauxella agrestis]|uniref:Zn-dependent hydrolase n=1 Tax=Buttiauxella agrestis ATCC 33320 TaxID=1006004 RepID=A0A085FZK5_9ENTR|nr:MBL fold metallo-hydrolase [Buttiauxella agrestis]KFC76900.1 Zn-dependent hydrolase [Buttiauxella agrestis ATCC 33320]